MSERRRTCVADSAATVPPIRTASRGRSGACLPRWCGSIGTNALTSPPRWPGNARAEHTDTPHISVHNSDLSSEVVIGVSCGPLLGQPGLERTALAQLAAVGATALFAGSTGTPLFCAACVFTLQGDPALLPVLLLVSAVAAALGERWRGEGWNEHQVQALLDREPSGNSVS